MSLPFTAYQPHLLPLQIAVRLHISRQEGWGHSPSGCQRQGLLQRFLNLLCLLKLTHVARTRMWALTVYWLKWDHLGQLLVNHFRGIWFRTRCSHVRNRATRTQSPIADELYMLVVFVPPTELTRFCAGVSSTGDINAPEKIPAEEMKEIWIARNCSMRIGDDGERRWVATKPFKIFSKQLSDEIVTYADVQTLGRPGMIAARFQVINDAVRLIDRFPEPPVGDPNDLRELRDDLETISAEEVKNMPLKIEAEARSRIMAKLQALYSIHGGQHCSVCLTEAWPRLLI